MPSALHELRGKPAATIASYGPNSYWEAHVTAGTPSRVLAAFTRELASPEPLLRTSAVRELTFSAKLFTINAFVPDTGEQLSPAAQAARSRSTTPVPAPVAAATGSTTPSADAARVAAEAEPSGRSR
ncbi:DUF317 domain-containing protein [Kitasatospora sp. NPDC057015]|uniref:DUF317 domain-containing protein n=1 Tax=Kitasatospora sp. NPDC057015 TaxID=3346001 RepID=UPI00363459A6